MKYWYQYIKKEKGLQDSIALLFGTAVHSALEELGKRLQAGEPLTAELCEEIAQMMPAFAAQNNITDMALIKEGQQFVRDRIYKHNPDYKIISTELSFFKRGLTTNKGAPLNGVVDLLMEMDPETAIVLDYKTSRKADSVEEAQVDIQLSMYDLMVSKLYPQYKHIWLVLDFVRSESVITSRSPEERRDFEEWVNELWVQMGQKSEADVVPTLNVYCPWCQYRHLCKEYESLLKEPVALTPTMSLTDEKEFVEAWKQAKLLEKTAKNRIEELKGWADRKVAYEGQVKFEDDDTIISWGQGSRKFYDPKALVPHIPATDLARLINVKNGEIENYSHTRPDLKPIIERAVRSSPGSARITMRNK